MMFTDKQLRFLKESAILGREEPILDLIERLEAAEAVIAESLDHSGKAHIGFDDWHEAYEAWRKAAGR